MKYLLIAALLFSAVLAEDLFLQEERFLANATTTNTTKPPPPSFYGDNVTIPFKVTLGCGACVRGSYIFCYKGVEGEILNASLSATNQKCCMNATDCATEIANLNWTCSNLFTDTTFAKFACPFIKTNCGPNNTINFEKEGERQDIPINLEAGQTCFYQVNTKCGLPDFALNSTSGLDIEYVDYDEEDVPSPTPAKASNGTGTTKKDDLKGKRPRDNMPERNATLQRSSNSQAKGPQAGRFDPTKESERQFKGGMKLNETTKCKPRHTLVSITSLVNSTATSRILQTATTSYLITFEADSGTSSNSYSQALLAGLVFVASIMSVFAF
jgi:hypothetical protein